MTERSLDHIAEDAKFILNNPLFKEAFEKVRDGYIYAIEQGDITDEKRRDKLMLGLQNLKAVKDALEGHIANAQLSNYQPEDI